MKRKSNRTGFTLVELIAVLAILAILSVILIPVISGFVLKAEEQVCRTNRREMEQIYLAYLTLNQIEHSESMLNQFISDQGLNICPSNGDISYVDGHFVCSLHDKLSVSDETDPGDEIPFLHSCDEISNRLLNLGG